MTTHRFRRRLSDEAYDFSGPAVGPQTLDAAQAGDPAGDEDADDPPSRDVERDGDADSSHDSDSGAAQ